MSLFSKRINDLDRERIINSFPTTLKQDVEQVIKIVPAAYKVQLITGQFHSVEYLTHPNKYQVWLNGEVLEIPYRVYFNEPDTTKEKKLSDVQRSILYCIYLRHWNGHIRQQWLEKLIHTSNYFTIPFTLQLLGEYVMEVLEPLNRHVNENTLSLYIAFIQENPKYWQLTASRMISYWNKDYRSQFPKLKNYIGKHIVDRINCSLKK